MKSRTYEYIVVSVFGWGKRRRRQNLQQALNVYSAEGWRLRQILHAYFPTPALEMVLEREVNQSAQHVTVMT